MPIQLSISLHIILADPESGCPLLGNHTEWLSTSGYVSCQKIHHYFWHETCPDVDSRTAILGYGLLTKSGQPVCPLSGWRQKAVMVHNNSCFQMIDMLSSYPVIKFLFQLLFFFAGRSRLIRTNYVNDINFNKKTIPSIIHILFIIIAVIAAPVHHPLMQGCWKGYVEFILFVFQLFAIFLQQTTFF